MDNTISRLYKKNSDMAAFYQGYVNYLHERLMAVDGNKLAEVADIFLKARAADRTIYFAGNGGSAATASHFSQDLATVGRKANVSGFRTLSLTDNTAYITAAGNDYGYDSVFTTQMQYLFNAGDVLVVISASGNSANVVEAARMALERNGTVIALTGFDGGQLATMTPHCLLLETPKGEYGPVEDAHMLFDHILTGYLTLLLQNKSI